MERRKEEIDAIDSYRIKEEEAFVSLCNSNPVFTYLPEKNIERTRAFDFCVVSAGTLCIIAEVKVRKNDSNKYATASHRRV